MLSSIAHLPMNPKLKGQAEIKQHIVYSSNGQELTLLLPWAAHDDQAPMPLIVFVQGSGWTTPNLDYEIPMLSHFAEEGIAVATVSHRSTRDGHLFPAYLQDVKCAIRYLRAHAAEYAIDPARIAAFGTSSGGNTVCLLGLTGDDPRFRTDEYPEESDAICAVVSCFAPTDLAALYEIRQNPEAALTANFGPNKDLWPEMLHTFSPVDQVQPGKAYPPFLLLHGTNDSLVPHQQMESLYIRLTDAGASVKAYYVDGAEHEGNFWSPEVRKVIHDELLQQLHWPLD